MPQNQPTNFLPSTKKPWFYSCHEQLNTEDPYFERLFLLKCKSYLSHHERCSRYSRYLVLLQKVYYSSCHALPWEESAQPKQWFIASISGLKLVVLQVSALIMFKKSTWACGWWIILRSETPFIHTKRRKPLNNLSLSPMENSLTRSLLSLIETFPAKTRNVTYTGSNHFHPFFIIRNTM